MIRDGLWNSQGLTTTEKTVALCLVHFRNEKTNRCTPAQTLLAQKTGLSIRAVSKALASLQDKMVIAIWPGEDGFRQYDFWLPAFNVNSTHVVRVPKLPKVPKCVPDHGCIAAWEAEKIDLGLEVVPGKMTEFEFLETLALCRSMPKPEPIEPWPLNLAVLRHPSEVDTGPEPTDLIPDEWAQHRQRADELMGVG